MSWFVPEPRHFQPIEGGPDDLGPFAQPIVDPTASPPPPPSPRRLLPRLEEEVDTLPKQLAWQRDVAFRGSRPPQALHAQPAPHYAETAAEEDRRWQSDAADDEEDEQDGSSSGRSAPQRPRPPSLPVDIYRDKEAYVLTAELPGVSKRDMQVDVRKGLLSITADKSDSAARDDRQRVRAERSYGQLSRQFALPPDADADRVTARSEDGLLQVTVPRRPWQREKNENPAII